MKNQDHPAVKLGHWVKQRRLKMKKVASRFALEVNLDPATYTEFELGAGSWVKEAALPYLFVALGLDKREFNTLKELFAQAKKATVLNLEDVFDRKELMPIRLRSEDEENAPTAEEILDCVFSPLV